ncbi:hypothetical protein LUZ60_013343 [Juncus effusus]|nr:hypothetical protein LUZ60_013343 [Juncus effusus]
MSTKMKRQSTLNPHATPFIPFSKSPIIPSQDVQKPQPKITEENADVASNYWLPDSIDFESEEQKVVENISNLYPDIPLDFIIEFAGAHGYDFELTVDMLEQFYNPNGVVEKAESSSQSQREGEKETESPVEK